LRGADCAELEACGLLAAFVSGATGACATGIVGEGAAVTEAMNGAAETKTKFAANAAVNTLTAIAAAVAPVLRIPFLVFIGTPKRVRLA